MGDKRDEALDAHAFQFSRCCDSGTFGRNDIFTYLSLKKMTRNRLKSLPEICLASLRISLSWKHIDSDPFVRFSLSFADIMWSYISIVTSMIWSAEIKLSKERVAFRRSVLRVRDSEKIVVQQDESRTLSSTDLFWELKRCLRGSDEILISFPVKFLPFI